MKILNFEGILDFSNLVYNIFYISSWDLQNGKDESVIHVIQKMPTIFCLCDAQITWTWIKCNLAHIVPSWHQAISTTFIPFSPQTEFFVLFFPSFNSIHKASLVSLSNVCQHQFSGCARSYQIAASWMSFFFFFFIFRVEYHCYLK